MLAATGGGRLTFTERPAPCRADLFTLTTETEMTTTLPAPVAAAIASIELGNNGHADIGNNPELAAAVSAAGYPVIPARDLHGNPVYRGYTPRAYAIRCNELKRPAIRSGGGACWDLSGYTFDAEGAILARQEARGYFD